MDYKFTGLGKPFNLSVCQDYVSLYRYDFAILSDFIENAGSFARDRKPDVMSDHLVQTFSRLETIARDFKQADARQVHDHILHVVLPLEQIRRITEAHMHIQSIADSPLGAGFMSQDSKWLELTAEARSLAPCVEGLRTELLKAPVSTARMMSAQNRNDRAGAAFRPQALTA